MKHPAWTEAEWRIACEMKARNCDSYEIAAKIGKKPGAVRNKFHYRANQAAITIKTRERRKLKKTLAKIPKNVGRFERAMLTAINRGDEKVAVGTFKDDRPLNAKNYQPGLVGSGCSSPAFACCD